MRGLQNLPEYAIIFIFILQFYKRDNFIFYSSMSNILIPIYNLDMENICKQHDEIVTADMNCNLLLAPIGETEGVDC